MKYVRLFLLVFLWCFQISACEQPTFDSYLKDLEEQGYCVIPQVLPAPETKLLYERVWHEYIEKAWPHCKMDDRSNWKEAFPIHNRYLTFAGPAGQTQVMWDLRQDPRIVDVFAKVWNTNDLIVSMDGISLICPPEIREDYFAPWPHVDQATECESESPLKTKPFTIQGQFLFEDSLEGDEGFYCIPKSHLRFGECIQIIDSLRSVEAPQEEKWRVQSSVLFDWFGRSSDASGSPYKIKHVTARRGSLILWDSRTVHWNQSPKKTRPYNDHPRMRMVGYLCYVPKARLTEEGRIIRKEAFEKGVATGHNPARPELKYSKDHVQQEFEQYLEDPSYTQPTIHLTPLGESLL